jgi:hypothetical protein
MSDEEIKGKRFTAAEREAVKTRLCEAMIAVDNGEFLAMILTLRNSVGEPQTTLHGSSFMVDQSALQTLTKHGIIQVESAPK